MSNLKNRLLSDLKNQELSNTYIIQRYLCHGSSPIIDDDKLFTIKHEISCMFKIHPNEVILTGSGKLGFSLAPGKTFKEFNDSSDIDIAIISSRLFEQFWKELLEFNVNITSRSRSKKEQEKFYSFINYLFKGWIRPDLFPFNYEKNHKWFEFFNELTSKIYEYGEHKITAGIYKDFFTFELYNEKNINRIRNEIKGNIQYE